MASAALFPTTAERAETRVAALRQYAILDTPPEQVFDDISQLTSFICGTPIATVTLLDLNRQWFKSRVGLENTESPISDSICATAAERDGLFLVHDATKDERFAGYHCVTGAPHIRFYAGAPLINPEGIALGTLCAIDRVPRDLTSEQKAALSALARQVMMALELRRTVTALDRAQAEKRAAESEVVQLRSLLPMCAWCRKIRDDEDLWLGVEEYLTTHAHTTFSHGICPDCTKGFRQEMVEKRAQAPNISG